LLQSDIHTKSIKRNKNETSNCHFEIYAVNFTDGNDILVHFKLVLQQTRKNKCLQQ